jgi:transposase
MPGPQAPQIVVSESERAELEQLVRAYTTGQQVARRARVVLLAAEGRSTAEVARRVGIDVDTARDWRARWGARPADGRSVAARLADAPKSGVPARITPEQICQIIALACEIPAHSDRPISQWSQRELADEIMARGIVDRISPRHAGRLLQRSRSEAPPDPLLAHSLAHRTGRGKGGEDRGRL